jgi:alkaline phosphatase
VRREALGQLRGVIVTAPDQLRQELRGLPVGRLLERCSRFRRSSSGSADELATRLVLRSLARRIEAATLEAAELERELLGHVRALAPQLLDEPGVGTIVAAQLIVAWSHHGRVRSEAAFHDSPASRRSPPRADTRSGIDSAAAATASSTAHCTQSSCIAANTTRRRRPTSSDASPKVKATATPAGCSSATSPATSTGYCKTRSR